jgi:hypothetical protein
MLLHFKKYSYFLPSRQQNLYYLYNKDFFMLDDRKHEIFLAMNCGWVLCMDDRLFFSAASAWAWG